MMKVLVLVLSALAFISADESRPTERNQYAITNGIFQAPLDSFLPTQSLRLNLHYALNAEHFTVGGPLFFYVHLQDNSGDTEMHTTGLVYDLARKLNGAVIKSNFRYLGQNIFVNSTQQKELTYMTLDHILADIPYLVNQVKEHLNSTHSSVVAFGSRIGGLVATLARKKFPHIIDGAWSSSGMFRSAMTETSFYNDVARQVHIYGGANCSSRLSTAFQQVKEIVDAKNVTKLRELFRIEGEFDLDKPQDVQYFYISLFEHLPDFVHIAERENSLDAFEEICTFMNSTDDALQAYMNWHNNLFGDLKPNFSYKTKFQIFQSNLAWRAYEYFYCTQYGSRRRITTANNFENIYPNVITEQFYDEWCADLFGATYNRTLLERASNNFNLQHGGDTQFVNNVIFSEGNLNPYRGTGVTNYNNQTSEFVSTQVYAADADIYEIDEEVDTAELIAVKTKIVAALKRFIGRGEE